MTAFDWVDPTDQPRGIRLERMKEHSKAAETGLQKESRMVAVTECSTVILMAVSLARRRAAAKGGWRAAEKVLSMVCLTEWCSV